MKTKILALCDPDSAYIERFSEYINQKESLPFSGRSFTSVSYLEAFILSESVDVILMGSEGALPEIQRTKNIKVIRLSEGEEDLQEEGVLYIYKYQSLDHIMRLVMDYCSDDATIYLPKVSNGRIIGVFSPVNRCFKTSFALTLGQLLGREEPALYLNLEAYSGLYGLFGEECRGDLSDALYYYRQNDKNMNKIRSLFHSMGSLDYIPPVLCPEDLFACQGEVMGKFILDLEEHSGYRTIIVDLGTGGWDIIKILQVCHQIYMPTREDYISRSKIEEFETYLQGTKNEGVLSKIQKLHLPKSNGFVGIEQGAEQLIWGELGDFVRDLLKGGLWKNNGSI